MTTTRRPTMGRRVALYAAAGIAIAAARAYVLTLRYQRDTYRDALIAHGRPPEL